MKTKTIVAAVAIALVASPALAKKSKRHHRVQVACADRYVPQRSLADILLFSTGPEPQANGCAPAVYSGGRFIGQDPDERIRAQLRRNPDLEGYHFARP
jgi:hypothetical protein